jgi:hypothetical protein
MRRNTKTVSYCILGLQLLPNFSQSRLESSELDMQPLLLKHWNSKGSVQLNKFLASNLEVAENIEPHIQITTIHR